MKNKKLLSLYIPFTLSFFLLSQSLFAKSIGHISNVLTVGQQTLLNESTGATKAPELIITLTDGLKEGDRFYLHLEDASWTKEAVTLLEKPHEEADMPPVNQVVGRKVSSTEMEIHVTKGDLKAGTKLTIPLYTTVVGDTAQVRIENNNTTLSDETLTFANISSAHLAVTPLAAAEKVIDEGMLPKLLIEEVYGGQLQHLTKKGALATFIIRLDSTDFAFEMTPEAKLIGEKAFEGIVGDKTSFTLLNSGQLQVTLPKEALERSDTNKGAFVLEGIKLKTTSREPKDTLVNATIEGAFVEKHSFKALELGDFAVHLITPTPTEVLSGKKQQVSFTLKEDVKDSLLKNRPIIVSLDGGIRLPQNADGKVAVTIEGQNYAFDAIMEDTVCVGFEIPAITDASLTAKSSLAFTFDTIIPANAYGKVTLHVEGRALPTPLQATVFNTVFPVNVDVSGFHAKSGIKDQMGGNIAITEHTAGALIQGKKLFIAFDTDRLEVSKMPQVVVTQGDLRIGEAVAVAGGIEIPIIGHSTTASTLVVKHFGLTLDGTVPAGKYEVAVGGPALSVLSGDQIDMTKGFEHLDPVVIAENFVLVDVEAVDKRIITFKLGEEAYAVNGKYHHLDVPAYLEDGRVMVPIRYVAEALDIPKDKMKYDQKEHRFTLYSDKVIEVQVGSQEMYVDGIPQLMQVATQERANEVMVPMSEIARALGLEVSWDAPLKTATFIRYGN
ncbi:MAG: copper amine oxidase N-terminal domain-containing protein [Cellulosilyticaceae bacterium]